MKLNLEVNPLDPQDVEAAIAALMPFAQEAQPALRHPNGSPDYTQAEQEYAEAVAEEPAAPTEPAAPAEPAAPTEEYLSQGKSMFAAEPADGPVDARGMPWDERIHASTRTKLANGNWKNKRGVDPQLLAEVESELLGKSAPTPPPSAAETTEAPAEPTASEPAAAEWTFPAFITAVTTNGISPDKINTVLAGLGVTGGIMALNSDIHSAKLPFVAKELGL